MNVPLSCVCTVAQGVAFTYAIDMYKLYLFMIVLASACGLYALPIEDSDTFPVEPGSLDIVRIERFRVPDMGTGLRLEFRGPADVAAVRILLNTGRSAVEETTGADFLIEGGRGYTYPEGAVGWAWDEARTPVLTASGNTLTVLLPAEAEQVQSWAVETITPEWNLADRYPEAGLTMDPAKDWPPLELPVSTLPEDLSDWYEQRPATLSFLLDAQLKNISWEDMETTRTPLASMGPGWFANRELVFQLEDVVSHKVVTLEPKQFAECGAARLLSGRELEVDWSIMLEPVEEEGLRVTAQWTSKDVDRALRFSLSMPVQGASVALPISDAPYALCLEKNGLTSVETNPFESRREHVFYQPENGMLGVAWSFALTQSTSNFPGRAAFRAIYRNRPESDRPLREFLSDWYTRYGPNDLCPALAGVDLSSMAGENWIRINPFTYKVELPPDAERDVPHALQSLAALAVLGGDWGADQARAALHAAVRNQHGDVAATFTGSYAQPALTLETCPDLEYPVEAKSPLSPAMAARRLLRFSVGESKHPHGVVLSGMDTAFHGDADPIAMAVADYPAVFDVAFAPVLSPKALQMEFTVPFVRAMRARAIPVAVEISDTRQLQPMLNADAIVYRTAQPLSFSDALALRVAAGRRPVVVSLMSLLNPAALEATLKACRMFGCVPRLEPEAGSPPDALVKARLLGQAVAQAGWQVAPAVRSDSPSIHVEAFGPEGTPRYLMLYNPGSRTETVGLHVQNEKAPLLVLDPLTGWSVWWQPGQALDVPLDPGQLRRLDVIGPSDWPDEEAVVNALDTLTGFGTKTTEMLNSLRGESEAGIYCSLQFAPIIPTDESGVLKLEVLNGTKKTIEVQDARIIGAARYRPFMASTAKIGPRRSAQIQGKLHVDDSGGEAVFEVQWSIVTAKGSFTAHRYIQPEFMPGISIKLTRDTVLAPGELAFVELDVMNHASRLKTLNFFWSGDFDKGSVERVFGPGSLRQIRIPIMEKKRNSGEVKLRVEDDVFRYEDTAYVRFLPRTWGHLYDSGVELSASSTAPGYSCSDLTDGVLRSGVTAGQAGAWAAMEVADQHWVQAQFEEPKSSDLVRVYWIEEDGRTWKPRRVRVQGQLENGTWADAKWAGDTIDGASEYALPQARYVAVKVQQAPETVPSTAPCSWAWLSCRWNDVSCLARS